MRELIGRLFSHKTVVRVMILSGLVLVFNIFTYQSTAVYTYNISGSTVSSARYLGTTLLQPIFLGVIFFLIGRSVMKHIKRDRNIFFGTVFLVLSQLLGLLFTWFASVYLIKIGASVTTTISLFQLFNGATPYVGLLLATFVCLLIGGIKFAKGIKSSLDLKEDYLGLIWLTTSTLMFLNPWVIGFFIFSWMMFELRRIERTGYFS